VSRFFSQVDVFGSAPCMGNPVAVVLGAEGLNTEQMQRFARWTNLSETAFVLPPRDPMADYRVRIFTPVLELPFAGHPTLGSCHAWLEAGGEARNGSEVIQECKAGLVRVRNTDPGFAFASPPLLRSGPPSEEKARHVTTTLDLDPEKVLAIEWVDNGPGWLAVLVESAAQVMRLHPRSLDLPIGVVGFYPPGSSAQIEVRGFTSVDGRVVEDPATGSLNASVARWLLGSGRIDAPYVAAQGGAIGRAGRIYVSTDDEGTIWVGGRTVTVVSGTIDL